MTKPIDRHEVLKVIKQWFEGKDEPLVAFPDKLGFPNVVYLYHDNADEMTDDVAQLTARASVVLKTPVMIFIDKPYRKPEMTYTVDEWLDRY